MTNGWQRVTRATPCPICKKPDYCCIGTKWILCMRSESSRPCKSGGWFHELTGAPVAPRPKQSPEPKADLDPMLIKWRWQTEPVRITELANALGVTLLSLRLLGVSWAPEHRA